MGVESLALVKLATFQNFAAGALHGKHVARTLSERIRPISTPEERARPGESHARQFRPPGSARGIRAIWPHSNLLSGGHRGRRRSSGWPSSEVTKVQIKELLAGR